MNTFIEKLKIVNNKYYTWYSNICQRALSRTLPSDTYSERHHILPKSIFPEYSKNKDNLVILTAREHFICHWLLTKIIDDPKIIYALQMMIPNKTRNRYQITSSIIYENLKKKFSKNNKGSRGNTWYTDGINNAFTKSAPAGFIQGRTFSNEHKLKLKGIPKTLEQKQKQSASMQGKPGLTGDSNPAKRPEVREKISKSRLGTVITNKTKLKMRLSKLGKKRGPMSEETKLKISLSKKKLSP
jgi:hypothetical protein